jgi:hypothetical protein
MSHWLQDTQPRSSVIHKASAQRCVKGGRDRQHHKTSHGCAWVFPDTFLASSCLPDGKQTRLKKLRNMTGDGVPKMLWWLSESIRIVRALMWLSTTLLLAKGWSQLAVSGNQIPPRWSPHWPTGLTHRPAAQAQYHNTAQHYLLLSVQCPLWRVSVIIKAQKKSQDHFICRVKESIFTA